MKQVESVEAVVDVIGRIDEFGYGLGTGTETSLGSFTLDVSSGRSVV